MPGVMTPARSLIVSGAGWAVVPAWPTPCPDTTNDANNKMTDKSLNRLCIMVSPEL